jgi:hypothetical protein
MLPCSKNYARGIRIGYSSKGPWGLGEHARKSPTGVFPTSRPVGIAGEHTTATPETSKLNTASWSAAFGCCSVNDLPFSATFRAADPVPERHLARSDGHRDDARGEEVGPCKRPAEARPLWSGGSRKLARYE